MDVSLFGTGDRGVYNLVKYVFLEKKANFLGNKTVDQRSGVNLKKTVFCKNLLQIFSFLLFS